MMILGIALIVFSPYLLIIPILYMAAVLISNHQLTLRQPWLIGLVLLFVWALIVGFLNKNEMSILASLAILAYFIVSNYIQYYYRNEYQAEKLLSSLFAVSIGSAVIGILEKLNIITMQPAFWKFLFGIRSIVDIQEKYRIAGTFNNPNLAGTWYASMILIGYYFFKKSTGRLKWIYGIGIILFFLVLLLTGSRGAIFGFMLGMTIYAYMRGQKKKMLLVVLSIIFLSVVMLLKPDWFPRGDILYSSITDRWEIWIHAFHMLTLKPFIGWGILGIYYASPSLFDYLKVFHAHNTLLSIIVELGIIGLLLFFWLQWIIVKHIVVLHRKAIQLTPILAGILAIAVGQGLFDFTIMSPQIGLLFVICSSLIIGLGETFI